MATTIPPEVTEAVGRLDQYNGEAYDADDNPFGFSAWGHRINHTRQQGDIQRIGRFLPPVVAFVAAIRDLIAPFVQQATGYRIEAQGDVAPASAAAVAAGEDRDAIPAQVARLDRVIIDLTLPDPLYHAGKFLRVRSYETGYLDPDRALWGTIAYGDAHLFDGLDG